MIRLLLRLFTPLIARLDHRPPPACLSRCRPIGHHNLARHIHAASIEPPPIGRATSV